MGNELSIRQLIYDLCHPFLKQLRTNRFIIRSIFGVRIPRGVAVNFDPTTVLLKHALRQVITPDDRAVLELGIGQAALVSLSLALTRPLEVDGIDCSALRVASSRQVAEYNGVEVNFFESDLFSNMPPQRRYDLIFFNPPYVPTQIGQQLKLTQRLRIEGDAMWDGGDDGTLVLRRFLHECPAFLRPNGRVIFGVQAIFIPDEKVREVIAASQLELTARITRRLVPSVAYVLERRL